MPENRAEVLRQLQPANEPSWEETPWGSYSINLTIPCPAQISKVRSGEHVLWLAEYLGFIGTGQNRTEAIRVLTLKLRNKLTSALKRAKEDIGEDQGEGNGI